MTESGVGKGEKSTGGTEGGVEEGMKSTASREGLRRKGKLRDHGRD